LSNGSKWCKQQSSERCKKHHAIHRAVSGGKRFQRGVEL